MPTTFEAPLIRAIWPAIDPVAPAAPDTRPACPEVYAARSNQAGPIAHSTQGQEAELKSVAVVYVDYVPGVAKCSSNARERRRLNSCSPADRAHWHAHFNGAPGKLRTARCDQRLIHARILGEAGHQDAHLILATPELSG